MTQRNWKAIVEAVGIAAIVASLVFVGYQLRQDRRLAGAQVIVASDAVELEMSALISQNSEVWLKGLKGEELSAVEEMEFRAIAEAHYQKHLGIYQRVQLLGFGTGEPQAAQYAFDLYQYPLLRQIFLENVQLYEARVDYLRTVGSRGESPFINRVEHYLAAFHESETEIGEKLYFAY